MILNSKEYLAPIITPFEAQVAFTGKQMEMNEYCYAMTNEVKNVDGIHVTNNM